MELLLRALTRAYVHLVLMVFGGLLLVFSLVAKLPGTSGGEIALRDPPNLLSLILGISLLICGVLVAALTGISQSHANEPEVQVNPAAIARSKEFEHLIKMNRNSTKREEIAPARPVDNEHGEQSAQLDQTPEDDTQRRTLSIDSLTVSAPDYAERIVDRYRALSQTQKLIITTLYRLVHASETSIDDLTVKFNMKYPEKSISNPKEMYYRLQELSHLGFVNLHSIGSRSTKVVKIPTAGGVLLNGNLLDS